MAEMGPEKRWRWVLEVLAIVGIPSAVSLTFKDAVTQFPLRTVAIIALYETVLFIAAIIAKIWGKIEIQIVDKTATAIHERLEVALSANFRKQYLRHLIYRHRTFDVKGLGTQGTYTLQMEQVFVDLSIIPQPAHGTTASVVGTRSVPIPGKRYSIHDLLSSDGAKYPGLAIIGPPGSGKTTLLKHVTLTLAQSEPASRQWTHSIPVLLLLREHAELICAKPFVGLFEVIQESLRGTNCTPTRNWFINHFKKGHCVIMLDGLDEIPDPSDRRNVAAWIDDQIAFYPLNRFIVTSRPFGYRSNPLSRASVFEVRPFSPQQVRQFVYNWYLANEVMAAGNTRDPGVQMAAKTGADDLLLRLQKNQDLAELAVNPLLLTMIATVHRFRSSLPGRRVELYSEICDVFLGNRQRAKGVEGLDLMPGQKRRVLEPLAYEMMCAKTREIGLDDLLAAIKDTLAAVSKTISAEEFLKDIRDFSGVLVERENSVYSFAHLTFQEYLAAAHIRSHRLEQETLAHIHESWWHEVLRLYSAQGDASPIILECLKDEHPSIEALTLATQCMEEAFEVKPHLRDQLDRVLATTAGEDARRLLAQQRLKLRVRKLMRNEDRWLVDDSLLTCAEYQLFLDDQRSADMDLTPEHWPTGAYLSDRATKPVDGVRSSDARAFCAWLTDREDRGCTFRLPTENEASAEPLRLVAPRTPLFYWTEGDSVTSLASATEFELGRRVDILGTIKADLALITQDDLGLAGAVEWARECWTPARFENIFPEQVIENVGLGPTVDIDSMTRIPGSEMTEVYVRDRAVLNDLLRATFFAAALEFSRHLDAQALECYVDSIHKVFGIKTPERAEGLAVDLLWRLSQAIVKSVGVPHANELKYELSVFTANVRTRSERRATLGSPLQGATHRHLIAEGLAKVFPKTLLEFDERIMEWKAQNASQAIRTHRRAYLRLLTLTVGWILMSTSTDQLRSFDSGGGDSKRLNAATTLLQFFVNLALIEERISFAGPAAESLRIVREMKTDQLATLFEQQNQPSKASSAL